MSFTLHRAHKNVPCSTIVPSHFSGAVFAVGRMSDQRWWESTALRQLSLGIGMRTFHSDALFVRCPHKCPVLCLKGDISFGWQPPLRTDDGAWGWNDIQTSGNNQKSFYVHVTVHRNKFLFNKTNRRTNFSEFIFVKKLYTFRAVPLSIIRSFPLYIRHWYMSCRFDDSFHARPSWSCLKSVIKLPWHIPVQWKTPDDGLRYCPKHVEFLDKNKFGKSVRVLVLLKRNQKSVFLAVFRGRYYFLVKTTNWWPVLFWVMTSFHSLL